MKRTIWALLGATSLLLGGLLYANRPKSLPVSTAATSTETATNQSDQDQQTPEALNITRVSSPMRSTEPVNARPPAGGSNSARADALDKSLLTQIVDILVSPQSSYEQKRTAWKQLREGGKLDQAIGELEQRLAADPRTADYAAALGHAYLQKCGTIHDVREQGILAMQADKVFDTALNLDQANWEARYMKAVALSYWPPNMNKGQEVIEHFETLVQQQETQTPQPQFAETYLRLGDQYQKAGRTDEAQAIWERGMRLFPQSEELKKKLGAGQ